jgi:hypothetical protein
MNIQLCIENEETKKIFNSLIKQIEHTSIDLDIENPNIHLPCYVSFSSISFRMWSILFLNLRKMSYFVIRDIFKDNFFIRFFTIRSQGLLDFPVKASEVLKSVDIMKLNISKGRF